MSIVWPPESTWSRILTNANYWAKNNDTPGIVGLAFNYCDVDAAIVFGYPASFATIDDFLGPLQNTIAYVAEFFIMNGITSITPTWLSPSLGCAYGDYGFATSTEAGYPIGTTAFCSTNNLCAYNAYNNGQTFPIVSVIDSAMISGVPSGYTVSSALACASFVQPIFNALTNMFWDYSKGVPPPPPPVVGACGSMCPGGGCDYCAPPPPTMYDCENNSCVQSASGSYSLPDCQQACSTVVASPTSGPSGTLVTVTTNYYNLGSATDVIFSNDQFSVDGDNFQVLSNTSVSCTVPTTTPGPYTVLVGVPEGSYSGSTFTVTT